ncbi:MAG: Ppx/GppA family phosphatase, partial [Pseudomonadota bacterium]
ERYLTADPPTPEQVASMSAAIDAVLVGHAPPLPLPLPLVGTAGTVTTLAAVAQALEPYDPQRVHGAPLALAEVERQLACYVRLPVFERQKLSGLPAARADVITAGAAIVARIMTRAGAEHLIVNDRGIRWGLVYEMADRRRITR